MQANVTNPYESNIEGLTKGDEAFPEHRQHLLAYTIGLFLLLLSIHALLWFVMVTIEPFRPIYFQLHAVDIALLRIAGLLPRGQSLGFILVVIPVCGAIFHSSFISISSFVVGRFASEAGRGVAVGALVSAVILIVINALIPVQ